MRPTVYIYTVHRHFVPVHHKFLSAGEAIRAALLDLNSDQGWPVTITGPEGVVWEQDGPFNTRDSLESLERKLKKEAKC
jgi:hypothetical protein